MVIVIIGGTSGIGDAIADLLNQNNYTVIIAGRRVETHFTKSWISTVKMDVTDLQSVNQAIISIIQTMGHIDVLIQSAGQGAIGPVEIFPVDDVASVFNLNVFGALRVVQSVLLHMRQQKEGKIILINSLAAETGLPYQGVYCASKSALDLFAESLRLEVRPFGIQVCVIQPGDFKTEVAQHRKLPGIKNNSPYYEILDR